jgi:hypothetical protein
VSVTLTPGSSPGQASSSPVEGEGRLHGSAGGGLLPRVWGCPPGLPNLPPRVGARGLRKSLETVSAVSFLSTRFTTGFPFPVSTRTSSAGMTEEGARDSSLPKVWRVCFTFTSTSARACRGAKPLCRGFGGVPQLSYSPPKRGARGLKQNCERDSNQSPLHHRDCRVASGSSQ